MASTKSQLLKKIQSGEKTIDIEANTNLLKWLSSDNWEERDPYEGEVMIVDRDAGGPGGTTIWTKRFRYKGVLVEFDYVSFGKDLKINESASIDFQIIDPK